MARGFDLSPSPSSQDIRARDKRWGAEDTRHKAGKLKIIKFLFSNPTVAGVFLLFIIILVLYIVNSIDVQLSAIIEQYVSLTAKQTDSKYSFDKRLFYVTVDNDGTKTITFGYKSEVQQEQAEEAIQEASGSIESAATSVSITPATGDVIIDDWLLLRKDPSGNGNISTVPSYVEIHNTSKWSMGEGEENKVYNKWMVGLYADKVHNRPTIKGKTANVGIVNSSGRYWVAIGPSWFHKEILNSGNGQYAESYPGASAWFADAKGHQFDIVVDYEGKTYYIYCVMGDAKAHTYGDGYGYVQSGINWNGTENLTGNRDYSIVEWCGASGPVGASLNSRMSFKGIICY